MSRLAERLRDSDPCFALDASMEAADTLDACERALRAFLPRNVAINNPNVADDEEVPLSVAIGELRAVAAALAKLEAAR